MSHPTTAKTGVHYHVRPGAAGGDKALLPAADAAAYQHSGDGDAQPQSEDGVDGTFRQVLGGVMALQPVADRRYEYTNVFREMEEFQRDRDEAVERHNQAVEDGDAMMAEVWRDEIADIDQEAEKQLQLINAAEAEGELAT